MEVTVETALLQKALSCIRPRLSPLKNYQLIPALKSLHLKAGGSTLLIRGGNGEVFVECEIPADVSSKGKLVVPVSAETQSIFRVILHRFMGYTTEIQTEGNGSLTFKSGKAFFRVKPFSPRTYPAFPKMGIVAAFGPELVTELKRLKPCITDRVQHLDNLRLEGEAGRYALSATDGFVLGYINNVPGPEDKLRLKLPPSLARDLIRLKAGKVTLLEGSKFMGARFGTAVQTSLAVRKVGRTTPELKGFKRIFSIWLPSEELKKACRGDALIKPDGIVDAWLHLRSSQRVAELKIVGYSIRDSTALDSITVKAPFTGEFLSHDVMLEVIPDWLLNFFSVCRRDVIRFELLRQTDRYLIRLSGCRNQQFYFYLSNVSGLPDIESEE